MPFISVWNKCALSVNLKTKKQAQSQAVHKQVILDINNSLKMQMDALEKKNEKNIRTMEFFVKPF